MLQDVNLIDCMLTQGLNNSVDAAPELEDVSGATGNDSDQENIERRIAIQLNLNV